MSEAGESNRRKVALDYEKLPHAIARMVVMIPSDYVSSDQKTITASFNSKTVTKNMYTEANKPAFQYVLGASTCKMRIYAPSGGCAGFLVYDVLNKSEAPCKLMNIPAILNACVKHWEKDSECEKLALPLKGKVSGPIVCGDSLLKRIRKNVGINEWAAVEALMQCGELKVMFAGTYSTCARVCVCMYCSSMYVCVYICILFDACVCMCMYIM